MSPASHSHPESGPLSLRGPQSLRPPPSVRGPDSLWSVPPGGLENISGLTEGDEVAGATITTLVDSCMGVVCWLGRTPEGKTVTIHTLEPGASQAVRARFLAKAVELQMKTGRDPIEGVLRIAAVDPIECAYAGDLTPVGTMADLSALGWDLPRQAVFLRQLCEVLSRMHDAGIVHGCLRPENVLIDGAFKPVVANVQAVDIGEACRLDRQAGVTASGYAAPEVRAGASAAEVADVFSFGRLVQFLLLDREPENSNEAIPQLRSLEKVPTSLVRIVRRCTVANPTQRYPSAVAVLLDLDRWQRSHDVGMAHPSVADRFVPAPPEAPMGKAASKATTPAADRAAPAPPAKKAPGASAESADPLRADPHAAEAAETPRALAARPLLAHPRRWLLGGAVALLAVALVGTAIARSAGLAAHGAVALAMALCGLALPDVGPSPLRARLLAVTVLVAIAIVVRPAGFVADARSPSRGLRASRVEQRVEAFHELRTLGETHFPSMDFRGAKLAGANLTTLVLDGSTFEGADCSGCNLEGASLLNVVLTDADLTGARLSDANGTQLVGLGRARCNEATALPAGWSCTDGHPQSSSPM